MLLVNLGCYNLRLKLTVESDSLSATLLHRRGHFAENGARGLTGLVPRSAVAKSGLRHITNKKRTIHPATSERVDDLRISY